MKIQRLSHRFLAVIGLALLPTLAVRADYNSIVMGDHPVAYYPINATVDPTGTTATDLSGNGNNGTYVSNDPQFNTVSGPTAYLPDALAFDGFSSYVDLSGITNGALLNFGGTITMEAWVQPANTSEGPADILGKGYDSSQNYNEMALRANAGDFYGGSFNFGNNSSASVSGGVQTTSWSYVVVTYDGTNWCIYQNAQQVNQNPNSFGAINFADNWNIGVGSADAGPTGGSPRWFNGSICCVALYTNALTPAEILNHFYYAELNASPAASIPIIVTQPQSQAGFVGGSITFTVAAVSSPAMTNQWYKNGSPISGQTNTSLILNNLQLSDAANYTVAVGNGNGITNSAVASLTVSSGNNLRWNDGGTSGVWDTGSTANWLNLGNSTQTTFNPGDSVLFDDTPGVSTSISINDNVSPSVVTVNSSTNNYTFGGSSSLTGSASLVKSGSSTLTIVNPANLTGPVTIKGGVLYAGDFSFKNVSSVTITNDATLDFGGSTYNTGQPLVLSGTGVNNEGALYNSYNDDPNQVFNITLAGDTTFGGAQRWDWTGGSLTGPHKVTINWASGGYGEWNNVSLASNVGDIEVATGTLGLKNMGSKLGNAAANIIVDSGCQLNFWTGDSGYARNYHVMSGAQLQILSSIGNFAGNITFDNGSQFTSIFGGGNQIIGGAITLNGNTHFVFGDANDIFTNVIGGAGGFVWDAYNHEIILAAANTYTGPTVIGGGLTLALTNSGSISHSSTIFFGGGSPANVSLDVNGRPDQTLTLTSGQTLGGIGTLNGKLAVSAGATIAPGGTNVILNMTEGSSVTGTLSASNDITLGGNAVMKLNGSGVSDEIVSSTKITCGGTLTVANVSGSPLAAGNSFQLFSAPSLTGSFAISPATPGPGLVWDTTQLTVNGSLNVVSAGAGPVIQTTKVASGNFIFTGSGGSANANFVVYTQTNLANTNWIPVLTNAFDGSGNFNVTNAFDTTAPQLFYRIK